MPVHLCSFAGQVASSSVITMSLDGKLPLVGDLSIWIKQNLLHTSRSKQTYSDIQRLSLSLLTFSSFSNFSLSLLTQSSCGPVKLLKVKVLTQNKNPLLHKYKNYFYFFHIKNTSVCKRAQEVSYVRSLHPFC